MSLFGYKFKTSSVAFYFTVILAILWLLLIFGCGTRKTGVDLNKSKTEIKEGTSTDQKSGSLSEEKEIKEESNIQESNNDVVTTETTKKYDANGKLIEESTKTIVDKSTNKSTSTKKSDKTKKKETWLLITTKTYKLQIITTKQKHKTVEADKTVATNFGGSWFLILAVVIVVGAIFLYFYLKKK